MRKFLILLLLITSYILPITLSAQSVDLLWQGDAYTPPFYEGRVLWSSQSRITFLAIPQGLGNSANLNYKWTKNGTVLGGVSGVGKNTLSFTDTILSKPQTIKVDIVSSNDGLLASASTLVTPISPNLLVYENNPLYGLMFNKEIGGTYQFHDKEVTFAAFPLFFNAINRLDNSVNYEWETNVGGKEIKNSVTYRVPDNASGSSEIKVHASNVNKILQDSNKSFLVTFENQ